MPSLWASWVAWPMRLKKSIPFELPPRSGALRVQNACRCRPEPPYLAQPRACCAARRDEHLIGHGCSSSTMSRNLRHTFPMFHAPVRMHVPVQGVELEFYSLTVRSLVGRKNVRTAQLGKAPAAKAIFRQSKQRMPRNRTEAVRQSDWCAPPQLPGTAPRLDACASVRLQRTNPTLEGLMVSEDFGGRPGTVVPNWTYRAPSHERLVVRLRSCAHKLRRSPAHS